MLKEVAKARDPGTLFDTMIWNDFEKIIVQFHLQFLTRIQEKFKDLKVAARIE